MEQEVKSMSSDEVIREILGHQWQDAAAVALCLIGAAVALYTLIRINRRPRRRFRERL